MVGILVGSCRSWCDLGVTLTLVLSERFLLPHLRHISEITIYGLLQLILYLINRLINKYHSFIIFSFHINAVTDY